MSPGPLPGQVGPGLTVQQGRCAMIVRRTIRTRTRTRTSSTEAPLKKPKHASARAKSVKRSEKSNKMIVSVLEAGSLWRVRVPQGPAARHETITSALSAGVLQVRMAGPGCLTDDCPGQCPSHKLSKVCTKGFSFQKID